MSFYDLNKKERKRLVDEIQERIKNDLNNGQSDYLLEYFSHEDTYIRKAAYQAVGKIHQSNKNLESILITVLEELLESEEEKVRQTTVNAAGEIGKSDFKLVQHFFDRALFDEHHSVRNAVIGSIKKMSEKNPEPTLEWARAYLRHQDKEVRREICHGIELRGRTHPQDVLPLLKELQFDQTARVRNTLIHVLGQISYKKGCLQTVITALNEWENKKLVEEAIDEIVDVHERYQQFTSLSQQEAIDYIDKNLDS